MDFYKSKWLLAEAQPESLDDYNVKFVKGLSYFLSLFT